MQTNQQSKHVTTATQYTRTKDSTIVLKMQRIGQNGSPKTSQQKSHCRYRTIKLAIVIDRAIPRGQRSILYRVIRDSCRSMGNLVSWALVQDAIVKKKKRNGDCSIRSSSISNEAIPSDKGCDTWTRQSISACKGLVFNRECTRYAGQSARHRQSMDSSSCRFRFFKGGLKEKE